MQALSTILVAALALAMAGTTIYLLVQAPAHATLGTASELLIPTLAAIVLILLCCTALGLGAWKLWRAELKMASQLLGVLTALTPIMIWQGADAANVVFDGAEPTRHPTKLIEKRRNKDRDFLVLESWREPGAELLIPVDGVAGGHELTPGSSATIVVGAGAFGRPYALAIER